MMYSPLIQQTPIDPTLKAVLLVIFFIGMFLVVFSRIYVYVEQQYALKHKRPFYRNFILFRYKINAQQERLITSNFSFYNSLTEK